MKPASRQLHRSCVPMLTNARHYFAGRQGENRDADGSPWRDHRDAVLRCVAHKPAAVLPPNRDGLAAASQLRRPCPLPGAPDAPERAIRGPSWYPPEPGIRVPLLRNQGRALRRVQAPLATPPAVPATIAPGPPVLLGLAGPAPR